MSRDISSSDDVISLSDVTDRVEALREERDDPTNAEEWDHEDKDGPAELRRLEELLSDLRGYGGDHQWEGDWYPGILIRDSHFRDYAEELAEDCGMVTPGASWPNNCIDWDAAARQLQFDYSSVEFDGVTYWYR